MAAAKATVTVTRATVTEVTEATVKPQRNGETEFFVYTFSSVSLFLCGLPLPPSPLLPFPPSPLVPFPCLLCKTVRR
jgi:hypothetical protein